MLTCDRPASEIQGLEQRLVSRFEWGLVTDLQPPDVEMRLAILKKKAYNDGIELPEEIFELLRAIEIITSALLIDRMLPNR